MLPFCCSRCWPGRYALLAAVASCVPARVRTAVGGQDGYEFIGGWDDAKAVKETFLAAGEEYGIVHVGQWGLSRTASFPWTARPEQAGPFVMKHRGGDRAGLP